MPSAKSGNMSSSFPSGVITLYKPFSVCPTTSIGSPYLVLSIVTFPLFFLLRCCTAFPPVWLMPPNAPPKTPPSIPERVAF